MDSSDFRHRSQTDEMKNLGTTKTAEGLNQGKNKH